MIHIDYFILSIDKNVKNTIHFSNKNRQKLSENNDIVVTEIINAETKMTDYIKENMMFQYFHIFSDKIKKVIEFYEVNSKFYCIFITSKDMKKQYIHWKMDISMLDIVFINNIDRQENFYMERDVLNNKTILLAKYEKQEYVIVREDMAESILRRYPIGIKLKQVQFS